MTHNYIVTGMTCGGCLAKIKYLLENVSGVKKVDVDLAKNQANIEMEYHIDTQLFQKALADYPKYKIEAQNPSLNSIPALENEMVSPGWIKVYKPLLILFGYIIGVSLLAEAFSTVFLWSRWMNHFMAGFFLLFSFFKMLDLKGFADSYSSYDIIAKQWKGWGYCYAFLELILGLAFLFELMPLLTNSVTFIVMMVSIIGVLKSVLQKKQIKCACLGTVFNLPMSTVTIIEDALMIAMSGMMIVSML